jgi:tetratricopeptide (TPR) repeat protein
MRAGRRALALLTFAAALGACAAAPARGGDKADPREQTARAFFATGKYQDAIQIYAQMFAERPHPNHLVNIGRCYQTMGDPDHAIPSFREYLRKAKIDAAARKEVEGYIKEMEALKEKHSAAERAIAELAPKELAPAKPAVPAVAAAPATTPDGGAAPAKPEEKLVIPAVAAVPANATPAVTAAVLAPAAPPPANPVDKQLAAWKSQGEEAWRDQAKTVDEAKVAKIEGLLAKAPAADPRLAEYQLYLGNLYAAKHFKARLEANALRKKMDAKEAVSADEVKALEADANGTFLKAIEVYLKALKAKSFAKQDEVLYQLALVLGANNMEPRARGLLDRLVKTLPESKYAQKVAAATSPPAPAP